jgi:protein TonB
MGWVMADTSPAGRPGVPSARQPAWALGISLLLHLLAAAVILGYGQLRAGGAPGAPSGDMVFSVSLTDWPGQENGVETETEVETSEEAVDTPEVAEVPEPEVLDSEILEPEIKDVADAEVLESEKNLAELGPEEVVSEPKPAPIVARESPREERPKSRAGPAGPVGKTGPAGSAGSGASLSSTGGGGGGGDAAGYLKGNFEYIKKRIRQHLVYSPQAKRLGIQGTVTVAFIIGADGRAQNPVVAQTSGHPGLDESAIRAVHNASPFPPPPEVARIVIPISFTLK